MPGVASGRAGGRGGHQDGVLGGVVVVGSEAADGGEAAAAIERAGGAVAGAYAEPHQRHAARAAIGDGGAEKPPANAAPASRRIDREVDDVGLSAQRRQLDPDVPDDVAGRVGGDPEPPPRRAAGREDLVQIGERGAGPCLPTKDRVLETRAGGDVARPHEPDQQGTGSRVPVGEEPPEGGLRGPPEGVRTPDPGRAA
jgi:hypothetical protein